METSETRVVDSLELDSLTVVSHQLSLLEEHLLAEPFLGSRSLFFITQLAGGIVLLGTENRPTGL